MSIPISPNLQLRASRFLGSLAMLYGQSGRWSIIRRIRRSGSWNDEVELTSLIRYPSQCLTTPVRHILCDRLGPPDTTLHLTFALVLNPLSYSIPSGLFCWQYLVTEGLALIV